MGILLQNAFRLLLLEIDLPDEVDAIVDTDFPSAKKIPPLHVRIRLVYRKDDDREDHYSARALLRSNPRAFQNRLKAAMTASGIDRDLKFRRLALVRESNLPGGAVTQQMVNEFSQRNGTFIQPNEQDLRAIEAICRLEETRREEISAWLTAKKPVSSLALMRDPLGWIQARISSLSQVGRQEARGSKVQPGPPKLEPPPVTPMVSIEPVTRDTNRIIVGQRLIGGQELQPVWLEAASLNKHAVILAGAGSGKTVLVKRLVEEAALLGIPSVVIDAANDLARLGDPWPQPPETWGPDDQAKARAYFERTECIVWTPGREQGNPLSFSPLPDLASVKDDSDLLTQAVELASNTFKQTLALGQSSSANTKVGVLSAALRYFAIHGKGGLDAFVELLSDLPSEAGAGITKAKKYAMDMADQIRAAIQMNPLLRQRGSSLDDFADLFGINPRGAKTRVSVINFIGLPALESQQMFLNQLAVSLFTWLKRHPAPPQKPLQGLLILDEAKDFVPSVQSSLCKESIIRLAAQARKYGVGLIFATQAPKSIDHNVIANCATQFFGRANSPAAIETIQNLIQDKGGSGSEVARLETGIFYLHAERINGEAVASPIKIKTSMSLSHHPPSPLDEQGVLQRARPRNE